MSKTKIIGLLILGMCLVVIGCSNNENNQTNNGNNNNQATTDSTNTSDKENANNSKISKEEYKTLLIKNYEKYVKPINLDAFANLSIEWASKGEIENKEFLNQYITVIHENRINLRSFEQSMTNINIEDMKIDQINNKLVKECKVYIRDLDTTENYLEVIGDDILSKPSKEFIAYIEEILDKDELDQSEFEDAIVEVQNLLGIQLYNKKINE